MYKYISILTYMYLKSKAESHKRDPLDVSKIYKYTQYFA